MTAIIGAGLSGLIAATLFPNATVHEARDQHSINHKALLRFRSDALSRLTGIPFRKVTVRKSVWYDGAHQPINIKLANLYSRKTNGEMLDRSIWSLDPVERFIAPEDLVEQMIASVGRRINWNDPLTGPDLLRLAKDQPVISTIPMPVMNDLLFTDEPGHTAPKFNFKSVVVDRYRIRGADVHQTIYYPDIHTGVYRASITGDLLIVERSGQHLWTDAGLEEVVESFGATMDDISVVEESHHQRFGKIAPIDERWRRNFIFNLTHRYGIYSMGRFAVWRNILLDDTINDGAVVKRLINTGSYGAILQHSRSN